MLYIPTIDVDPIYVEDIVDKDLRDHLALLDFLS